MRKLGVLTAAAALVAVMGFSGTAWADEFADAVDSFTPPTGCETIAVTGNGNDCDISGDDENAGADAVGSDDSDGASLGFTTDFDNDGGNGLQPLGGVLVLNFTDNTCLDGTDPDFTVHEDGNDEAYDVSVGLQGGVLTSAGGGTGDEDLNSPVVSFNQVKLTATDGEGGTTSGADIDAVECLNNFDFGTAHIVKANTGDTTIEVGSGVEQDDLSFTITISNPLGEDLTDLVFIDVLPAEFDITGSVTVTAETDGGDCVVTNVDEVSRGKGNQAKKKQKLAPDFIEFTAAGLTSGQSCTITVDEVSTDDEHPGGGQSPSVTPTECPGGTIVLNEGVQVFDTNLNILLFVDDDSLALTCIFV